MRALVRKTSAPEKVSKLTGLGAESVYGDMKDPRRSTRRAAVPARCSRPLPRRCRGRTAIPLKRRQTGPDKARRRRRAAGVEHFVLISFPHVDVEFPLQSAKRAAEERLRAGRMKYTILQPTFFTEVWLSPALGFDRGQGNGADLRAGKTGSAGSRFHDVARFAVAALDNPHAANTVIKLGGPEALSPLEVVKLAEADLRHERRQCEHVPEDALRAQLGSATDSLQKSFAALMLYVRAQARPST